MSPPDGAVPTKLKKLLPLALLLLGTVLRAWELGGPSLTVDEATTVYFSAFPPGQLAQVLLATHEVHPPGYLTFLHGLMQVGLSETWLRLPSLLFGILTLIAGYWLFGLLEDAYEIKVAALCLLAFSSYHVAACRELRMYSLLTLLVTLGLAGLLYWLKTEDHRGLVAYCACFAGSYWVHYLSFFCLPVALVWLWLVRPQAWKWWLGATATSFLPFLAWVPVLLGQVGGQDLLLRQAPSLSLLLELFGRMALGDVGPAGVAGWMAAGVLVLGALGLAAREAPQSGARLCLSWLLVPILAVFTVSSLTSIRIFEFKYFVFTTPALCWLIASLQPRRLVVPGMVLVNLVTCGIVFEAGSRYGGDWRTVANYLRAVPRPDDAILVHPSMMATPLLYYGISPHRLQPTDQLDEGQLSALAQKPAVYLVTTPFHPFVLQEKLDSRFAHWTRTASEQSPAYLPSGIIRIERFVPPASGD
ncbi:MAG: hypothetical protein AB7S38_41080 [Vulcanimicrobiota bacterium]